MNSRKIWKWLYFGAPPLLYAGLIFYLSSLSHVKVPDLGLNLGDKLLHGLEYFGFAVLVTRAVHRNPDRPLPRRSFWLALLLVALYAASDEFHQYFVPGRDCSFFDFLADLAGSFLGALFYTRLHHLESNFIKTSVEILRRHESPAK